MRDGEKKQEVPLHVAQRLYKRYNVHRSPSPAKSFRMWRYALGVELEHGRRWGTITNVTDDSYDMTARIAVAHIVEFPDYYRRLKKMEQEAERHWDSTRRRRLVRKKTMVVLVKEK